MRSRWMSGPASLLATVLVLIVGAHAQTETTENTSTENASTENTPSAADFASKDNAPAETTISPDDSADLLNSQQQLQQTFTLKRTINGEVVESDRRTVTYSRDQPYRETEAGQSVSEALISRFDSELLTRKEAFEEAKLDFTVADVNRDGLMSLSEFSELVKSWRASGDLIASAKTETSSREERFEEFIAEISPEAAQRQQDSQVMQKFSFIAGASETISREDYIREYLLDFDTMDADKDTLLRGDELARFRAVTRGENVKM